jgi:hypothetical protein
VGVFKGGGGSSLAMGNGHSYVHMYLYDIMELESDTYDVVVIGTGLAQSIAAAYVVVY